MQRVRQTADRDATRLLCCEPKEDGSFHSDRFSFTLKVEIYAACEGQDFNINSYRTCNFIPNVSLSIYKYFQPMAQLFLVGVRRHSNFHVCIAIYNKWRHFTFSLQRVFSISVLTTLFTLREISLPVTKLKTYIVYYLNECKLCFIVREELNKFRMIKNKWLHSRRGCLYSFILDLYCRV